MYLCSECLRPVGAMLNRDGQPEPFLCPRTGRLADPVVPIRRKPPKPPKDIDDVARAPRRRREQREEAWT